MTTETELVITPSEGSGGAWADLEAGSYNATLKGAEGVGPSTLYPDSGERLKLTFSLTDEIDEETNAAIELFYYVTQKLTTGVKQSNLWKVAEALGTPPEIGKPFAIGSLIGKSCQVTVNIKDTTAGPRPFVAMIMPARKATKAAAQAAAPADDVAVVCCVPKCGKPVHVFDDEGTPFCEKHAP